MISVQTLKVGDLIPEIKKPPISRATLALYAGASNDDTDIHIDSDAAKAAGLGDVIGHGMLSMAYLGQILTRNFQPSEIIEFGTRFTNITHLRDELVCTGEVIDVYEEAEQRRVKLKLLVTNQEGDVKLEAEAIVGDQQVGVE